MMCILMFYIDWENVWRRPNKALEDKCFLVEDCVFLSLFYEGDMLVSHNFVVTDPRVHPWRKDNHPKNPSGTQAIFF